MAIKAFNVDEEVYLRFSNYCKELGLSMSKQVDMFMRSQIEEEPNIRQEYLNKLELIRKQKMIGIGSIKNLRKRYG